MKKIYLILRRRIQYYFYTINFFFNGDKIFKKIKKIRSKKNKNEDKLEQLYKKEIKNPLAVFEYASYKISQSDTTGFKILKDFEILRKEWLEKNQLDKKFGTFIPAQQFIGSLGNYYPLYYYILNYFYLEKNKTKPTVLLKENIKITNPEISKFFLPYLNIVENNSKFYKYNYLYEVNKVPLESVLPYKNKYFPWAAAMNFINQDLKKENILEKANFKISKDEVKKGKEKLAKFGIGDKDWFVVLHIREGKNHIFRNSNPDTYVMAIKEVISRGGYVVRVGDNSMTKLPKIKGLIDYPFTNLKSDFMDVFLASNCKFCIGTSSGYEGLPPLFGKPILFVNFLNTFEYFCYKDTDIFMPKTLIYKKNNELVPLKELFNFETGNLVTENSYKSKGIQIKDNTPEEILVATQEMFSLVNKKDQSHSFADYNLKFKKLLNNLYKNYFDYSLKPLANLPSSFLKKYNF